MSGFEQPPGSLYGKRDVTELITTQKLGAHSSLAVEADYGRDRVSGSLVSWKGIAIYGKYFLCSKSSLAIRGEAYHYPQGYTTGVVFHNPTFKELTVTCQYDPLSFMIHRLDFRDDFANGPALVGPNSDAATRSSQPTLLLSAVVTF